MIDNRTYLNKYLQQVCEVSPFASLLEMQVKAIGEGEATVVIPTIIKKHTNQDGFIHGGALASMVDMAMGVACATMGKRIWTLEMNTNFIRNVSTGSKIIAAGKVLHSGKTTMVAEAEIRDESGQLLAKGRGTFFVVGYFEDNPNHEREPLK